MSLTGLDASRSTRATNIIAVAEVVEPVRLMEHGERAFIMRWQRFVDFVQEVIGIERDERHVVEKAWRDDGLAGQSVISRKHADARHLDRVDEGCGPFDRQLGEADIQSPAAPEITHCWGGGRDEAHRAVGPALEQLRDDRR